MTYLISLKFRIIIKTRHDSGTVDTLSVGVDNTPTFNPNLSNAVESGSPFRMTQRNYTKHLAQNPQFGSLVFTNLPICERLLNTTPGILSGQVMTDHGFTKCTQIIKRHFNFVVKNKSLQCVVCSRKCAYTCCATAPMRTP